MIDAQLCVRGRRPIAHLPDSLQAAGVHVLL
jgi:hypothetical protein